MNGAIRLIRATIVGAAIAMLGGLVWFVYLTLILVRDGLPRQVAMAGVAIVVLAVVYIGRTSVKAWRQDDS